MKPPETLHQTLGAVRSTLEQMARWGVTGFDCSQQSLDTLQRWSSGGASPAPHGDDLKLIRADLGDCRRCGLATGRTHIVFGEGDPSARLVFVGEGPGFEEDRSGRPFVGPAGQLLAKIIGAMKLRRDQVYICNVIKCRPPGNRNPLPEEIKACKPFLERQLAALSPEVICTLGTFATQTLLDTTTPISRLRGRFHDRSGLNLMPTFHPAYLLRNPERKRDVWDDMKKIMAVLGIPL
jgi:uracil-DNA glycosylase family 4